MCSFISLYLYLFLYIFIYCFMRAFVYLCICVWMYLCVYVKQQMYIYVFVLLCKSTTKKILLYNYSFNIVFNGFNGFRMHTSISYYSFYIKAFLTEINKKSQFHFCSFKIIDYLSTMHIQYFRNRFQLYNNFSITNKIGSLRFSKWVPFIHDMN